MTACAIDGCERSDLNGRGMCGMHYRRWQRTGTTELAVRPSLADRFWAKVEKTDTCWLWTGRTDRCGYGVFSASKNHPAKAHRVAYELSVGAVPKGLHLDHLCRVRNCVNPAHLEPVTPAENNRRSLSLTAANARKTHCKHGHPFDEANTYLRPGGGRTCRTCRAARERAAA